MKKGVYRLSIFDHSGVLSDDRRPVYESAMVLHLKYGVKQMTFDEWLLTTNASAGEALQSQGVKVSKQEIDKLYAETYKEITTRDENPVRPVMYEDAPEVLAALKDRNFKIAIVSSHPEKSLLKELDGYGIAKYFDLISGDPSPKNERLKKVCKNLDFSVNDSFFVEDTIYGLRSGSMAGVDCFGITTGYHSRERLEAEGTAVAVVDSLTDLLKLV